MAGLLVTAVLLFFHHKRSHASPTNFTSSSVRQYGYCQQLDILVSATAPSAIYQLPFNVDTDDEAVAWAIWRDSRNTQATVLQNTTTSDTFNIHAQLCVPMSGAKADILQIATHGIATGTKYWDSEYKPKEHSYVDAVLKAGYSILTYDRLGVGLSDHPDAYTTAQSPIELEILKELTLMARNGSLYDQARTSSHTNSAFASLSRPSKIAHIGHSFGSLLTEAFIAKYGNLTDGTILSGWIPTQYILESRVTAMSWQSAATHGYDRPSGYVVSAKSGLQNIFFGGNISTAYTPELLAYGDRIKEPLPVGEWVSTGTLFGMPGTSFKGPLQYFLAENDFFACNADCYGLFNQTMENERFPNAKTIESYVQPNTGHAFPFHNNATAGFAVMFDFLNRNGL